MAVDRANAQQGQTVRLRAIFRLAGSLLDPFEIRQVEIRSSTNALITTIPAASVVRESLGTFYVDWHIATSEPANIHYDRWYATAVSGGTEEQFTFTFLVLPFSVTTPGASYMTVDEAREYLPEDSMISDAALEAMIALTQEVIETITGKNFLPLTESRTFDGNGRAHLPISRPILRVSEARVLACSPGCSDGSGDRLIDPCAVRISESGTFLGLGNAARRSDRFFAYSSSGAPPFHGACGVWPSGFRNIRITGDWGMYETVPLQIKMAQGFLIREALRCDDPKEVTEAAFSAESIPGDRAYTLREVWRNVRLANATGFPEVDAILARFKLNLSVGVV